MHAGRSVPPVLLLAAMLGGILGCSVDGSRPAATQVVRPYPAGCEAFGFSARRCAAIVAIARNDLKIQDPAAAVELLSEAPRHDCGPQPDGTVILCTRSGGGIAVIVRITPPAGTAREATFPCGVGGQHSIACTATPELLLRTPMDGYGDIACTGEDAAGNPTGCATPLPPIEPDALAAAQPLTVQWLEIPIDRDGPDEIEIGRVGIPNGRLSEARFAVDPPSLDDVLFDDEGIVLAVEPVDPAGRPFLNKYEHGWLPGVEVARVVLRFTVIQHEPGATLPIRDLVVR